MKKLMVWTEHFPFQKVYKVWTRLCDNGNVSKIKFELVNEDFFLEWSKIQYELHGKYNVKFNKKPAFAEKIDPIFFR